MPGSSHAAWCALLTLAAVSCGGGGGGGAGGSTPTLGRCTTGTELVLFYPVPNTRVPAKTTKSIYVASNYPIITVRSLAARPAGYSGGALDAYRLSGPVAAPTPTPTPTPIPTPPSATPTPSAKPSQAPTPFPSPPFTGAVYYVAQGFHLKPHQTYAVEVASEAGSCLAAPIPGARFFTLRF